jgi:hypothetical protein
VLALSYPLASSILLVPRHEPTTLPLLLAAALKGLIRDIWNFQS